MPVSLPFAEKSAASMLAARAPSLAVPPLVALSASARWTAAVQSYEDYIQELKEELNAIDRVLDVFAKADVDDEMLERIDW